MPDLAATAAAEPALTRFVAALAACALNDLLSAPGPFTIFAPHDAAFAQLPTGAMQELYADLPELAATLRYHIAPGIALAVDLIDLGTAPTLNGQVLTFGNADGIRVNAAHILQADIEADNGVIHIIDAVLRPHRAE